MMDFRKYRPCSGILLPDRTWPDRAITKAPIWCSVDLRDGNQALEIPMDLEQKISFFDFLYKVGFREIEVGFPAASDTEFLFARELIERNLIPDDAIIQVLTQSRDHIIERTFEALEGVKKAVVHLYNSTSTLQREVVFQNSREETIALAVSGAKQIKELAEKYGRDRFIFEYSPESFTGTELDFAVEICNAVIGVWKPDAEHKVIINLPATVEMSTPNIYADQIEYMCRNIAQRENVIISLHTHNDRGTGIAASELALMAGADRVEGTLFGNGERTGNADIMNLAMNLYSQGIDPKLDFSDIDDVVEIYEKSTGMQVHQRHPYAGELVYTAFSGSHQDAINKGMVHKDKLKIHWEVPYLPIDPRDVGRTYDPIIRINSQSGKGGVAYILEQSYGLMIPKKMQQDFSLTVTKISDVQSRELLRDELYQLFLDKYVDLEEPVGFIYYNETQKISQNEQEKSDTTLVAASVRIDGAEKTIAGEGNGLLDAFCRALQKELSVKFEIRNYSEHSLERHSKSRAITYIEIGANAANGAAGANGSNAANGTTGANGSNAANGTAGANGSGAANADHSGDVYFGAGISSSVSKSSLRAVISAVNNMLREKAGEIE